MTQVLDVAEFFRIGGYSPHRGQLRLHNSRARFRVLRCGRRWGKTVSGGKELELASRVLSAVTGQPQLGWVVGPIYQDAEKEFRVVYDSFRALGFDKDCLKFKKNADSGDMHIITNWGFELIGKSAAHPETLTGEGLDFVLMAEAGRHKRKTFAEYIRPALSDLHGWAILSGVPEGASTESLLYAMHQLGASTLPQHREWWSMKSPSWDNIIAFPGGRTDPEILSAEELLTVDEFKRQYGAEFVDGVGAVMKEWDDELHLADLSYNPRWRTFMACDYGYTEPTRILFIQVGPHGQVHVIKERSYELKDAVEVAEDLAATEGALVRACERGFGDPGGGGPGDSKILSRMLHIPFASGGSVGGLLSTRLTLIRRSLKTRNQHLPLYVDAGTVNPGRRPQLQIDRHNAPLLAWEMREGYRWPEKKSEAQIKGKPKDGNDHSVEALGRFYRGFFGAAVVPDDGPAQSTADLSGKPAPDYSGWTDLPPGWRPPPQ